MKCFLSLVIVFAVLLNSQLLYAAEQLDQSHAPSVEQRSPWLSFRADRSAGQSFTAALTGRLSRIEVLVASCAVGDYDATVTIHSGIDPWTPPLAVAVIPANDIPKVPSGACTTTGVAEMAAFVSVNLANGGPDVSSGQLYSIWLHSDSPFELAGNWVGSFTSVLSYPEGAPYGSNNATQEYHLIGNADLGFKTFVTVAPPAPVFACIGFASPLADGAVTVKRDRVLPHKAVLQLENGQTVVAGDIHTPPVLQVVFTAAETSDAQDVSHLAETAGAATSGNSFVFDGDWWRHNLQVKNYTAKGTYKTKLVSGNNAEYLVDGYCEATFVIY